MRKLHALCDRFQRIAPQVTELGNLEAGDEQEVEGHAGVESNAGEFDGLRHDSRRRVRIGEQICRLLMMISRPVLYTNSQFRLHLSGSDTLTPGHVTSDGFKKYICLLLLAFSLVASKFDVPSRPLSSLPFRASYETVIKFADHSWQ